MKEELTWRSYLDDIVRRKPAAQKKQLYEAVQVTRTAFQRWRSGENTPDAAHISLLLQALPDEEREHLRALMLDDPRVGPLLPREMPLPGGRATHSIPQPVYEEVLRLARDTPDRFWLLCSAILLHALSQLETHSKPTGMEISVARCMPPRSDGKVRSLRAYAGRGTPPWRRDLHEQEYFLGAESLAGYAVMQRHGIMIPDKNDSRIAIPVHWMEHEMSCAAYPILREGAIAGAIIVSCCVPDFFTQEKLTLIEHYADLIRLAFYDREFYLASSIELGLMPPWQVQQEYFSSFRERVQEAYKHALREQQPPLQDLAQVEARVRAELEGELLQLASRSSEGVRV